ncbi:MAG: cob(I)yrinic acid a,c-diamide adenosyltransferase [Bacteroidetes bacterium]|nr:cob(I)yrinic acid a,c-diamide adenosyltransferase [Bacteroidota bacterium]MBL0063457.1 cob(I)yrinic acid a,c-diamide adenosyltransferase [Bacteroidota bacterium]MBL0140115.1 cob(I)yrinic acid a,c-diamide adenosyltransferase [Bacteroidota bacterium]
MKIYTKKGDEGKTSLIGGTRVSKNHKRIDAYGTIDELNSWIGLLRDQAIASGHITLLLTIQDRLFIIGSQLAADPETSRMKLPELTEEDVLLLENAMDEMESTLPEMKHFVLPGGNPIVSYCHLARTVCRRAERCVVYLSETDHVSPLILKYLNRLSDYLFVLSRKLSAETGSKETPWIPGK